MGAVDNSTTPVDSKGVGVYHLHQMVNKDGYGEWLATRLKSLEEDEAHLTTTIRGLEERRKGLAEELGRLRAAMQVYIEFVGPGRSKPEPAPPADYGDLRRLTIADAAAAIMRQRGGNAAVKEMIPILQSAGKLGKNAYNVVASTLERQPGRFRKVGPGLWGLTGELLPESPGHNGNGASSS
jgi:hypothetical protein